MNIDGPQGADGGGLKISSNKPVSPRQHEGVGWRRFLSAIAALCTGFLLAVYSSVFAQQGRLAATAFCAIVALLLSGYVAVTAVPFLARRASAEWLRVSVDYQLTYEGIGFIVLVILLAIAGLNTGNNLLFLVVACLLSAILMSGVLSLAVLSGLSLDVLLPEHVFARRPISAMIRLQNQKKLLPSFSITLMGATGAKPLRVKKPRKSKGKDDEELQPVGILQQPVYFPFLPSRGDISRTVDIDFPGRGLYKERSFVLSTRFPFGFLEKKIEIPVSRELLVYPAVEPTEDFYEILPMLSGEIEAYQRGRGYDLYSLREMLPTDSARFVDWKASARSGSMKVREFAREDERRMQLVLDRRIGSNTERKRQEFEAAVELCACLAWHFYELDAQLSFYSDEVEIPIGQSNETVHSILRYLATVAPMAVEPASSLPNAATAGGIWGGADGAFRIVFTDASQGSVPTAAWSGAYYVFLDALLDREGRANSFPSQGLHGSSEKRSTQPLPSSTRS